MYFINANGTKQPCNLTKNSDQAYYRKVTWDYVENALPNTIVPGAPTYVYEDTGPCEDVCYNGEHGIPPSHATGPGPFIVQFQNWMGCGTMAAVRRMPIEGSDSSSEGT